MRGLKKKRAMRYLDITVLEAAKARLREARARYDHLWVAFSGGKDSLTMLELLAEVNAEDGITTPINVMFHDEEVINTSIVRFVEKVAQDPRFNFKWLSIPMNVGFMCMGKYERFVCWDSARVWHRQPPSYAIREVGVDTSDMDEWEIDRAIFRVLEPKGSLGLLLGIRTQESLKRFITLTAKEKDNWISEGTLHGRPFAKVYPIYDWLEDDVFKFFWEKGITYCPVYDGQMWADVNLRVSSSLHAQSWYQLKRMKETEPEYYAQLASVIPALETHLRYGKSLDHWQRIEGYAHTWEGIREWARDHLDPEHVEMVTAYVRIAERMRARRERLAPLGGVAVRRVFWNVLTGAYWGTPLSHDDGVTIQDMEFESA